MNDDDDGDDDVCLHCQAPIPGVVLSYRLSRSLRGWHPGHQELADGSAPDLSSTKQDQQNRQQQQQQQPGSEYGAIAKFAGMIRQAASRHAGLILIHRLSLSLLFHNRRSLPVPIRGHHLQTLLTLPRLPCTFFLLISPRPFSLLHRPTFLPSLFSSDICL